MRAAKGLRARGKGLGEQRGVGRTYAGCGKKAWHRRDLDARSSCVAVFSAADPSQPGFRRVRGALVGTIVAVTGEPFVFGSGGAERNIKGRRAAGWWLLLPARPNFAAIACRISAHVESERIWSPRTAAWRRRAASQHASAPCRSRRPGGAVVARQSIQEAPPRARHLAQSDGNCA
jgi:hypothetical protein